MAALRARLLADERGFALAYALVAMLALGVASAAVVQYASQNARSASRSLADQQAYALAEAAMNEARAVLFAAPDPRVATAVPDATTAYPTGTARRYGVLAGNVWTLTGIGTVSSPTGAAPVVRSVTSKVALSAGQRSSSSNAIWNYLYADSTTQCTELQNSVTIDIPLYVRGDLCMQNTARVTGDYLQVGGTVTLRNTAQIGSPDDPLVSAKIGGGCRIDNGAFQSPCSPAQRVFAGEITTAPDGLTKPPVDLAYWYANASPGPRRACTAGSFPGGFDDDGAMNRSRGTVDLMPATAYDCRVLDGQGSVVGQITWTPGAGGTPGRLVVAGTLFFDGDIRLDLNDYGVYSGRATIYASGTIELANNAKLCGVAGCGSSWDATQNLLAFVAGSATDPVGFQMSNNTILQGAVYAVGDFREDNSAVVWGPIIADEVEIRNSGVNHYVPLGTLLPGMPASYEEVTVLENVPAGFGG